MILGFHFLEDLENRIDLSIIILFPIISNFNIMIADNCFTYKIFCMKDDSELIPGLNMTTFVQTLEDRLMSSKFMWHNIACDFHDTDSTYCSQVGYVTFMILTVHTVDR